MRFIHTADWHLGRLFFGEHLTSDQEFVLQEFLHLVREERAEAVLIAGDIYDRAVPPTEAVELLDEILCKLVQESKVKVLLIAGNHDSAARLDFGSRLLERQGLFVAGRLGGAPRQVVLEDAFGEVAFALFPYAEPSLAREFYPGEDIYDEETAMRARVQAHLARLGSCRRKVAVAHAFIAGGQESDSERPLSVGGSFNVGARNFQAFQYTALGHLHHMQQAGSERIGYAGSLLKYSFDEANQKKGVRIVELSADGEVEVTPVFLRSKRDVCVIEGRFDDILNDRKRFPKSEDYVCVRLLDEQPILDVHRRLRELYANLMSVERPNVRAVSIGQPQESYRRLGEAELFEGFFKAMTGRAMDEDEIAVLRQETDNFLKENRGA